MTVPFSTAAVLVQLGYAERADGGHVLTAEGRRYLRRQERDAEWREMASRLTRPARNHADRVILWMRAHRLLASAFGGEEPSPYHPFYKYAEYVIAADHDGLPIVDPPGKFEEAGASAEGWVEWVVEQARISARLVAEFDEQMELAEARGRAVVIHYEADKIGHPNAVGEALRHATARAPATGAVDLTTYRERRPSRPGGGVA